VSLPEPRSRERPSDSPLGTHRVAPRGKFFFCGEEKFFVKGVTYGPFSLGTHGSPYPERETAEADFAAIAELGANCVRTFTPPPRWLLDLAASYGLRLIAGIPWQQHVCFMESSSARDEVRSAVARAVAASKDHPAVLAYFIGNEIPPDIVRWYGPKRIQRFLRELYETAKSADPNALVSYANFPSTEYLEIDFTDFSAFNVYLHRESDFRRYLLRLQNLAGDRPLVLTEIGIDSLREGRDAQARILSWQLRAGFESGLAGMVIFSWTDDWHAFSGPEGFQVEDWAFGLVERSRRKKPAFWEVKRFFEAPLPPPLPGYPKVSVIVCAYNAERTLERCLRSLEELRYPNYEVIIVNDGSTDRTREIAERYPSMRLINQENRGLSAARNAGLRAASGEIIAYTDSDCMADPDWLTYLVARFLSSDFAALGGPNLSPPEDGWIASCVAVSPGAPTHVLLDDEMAEHIPGCNMAFRRQALEAIGGFDPIFRAAGDDVDLCWRLQNRGYRIGFCPAAVVWHFRRNTVRDYLKQQRGYGKAETLLYFKHPYRFNILGQSRWFGRIYGDISSFFLNRAPRIYGGVFGRGLFQTLYQAPAPLLSYLPLTLEWNLAALPLAAAALALGGYCWLALAPLSLTIARCVASALQARLPARYRGARSVLLVSALILLGPLARSLERYRWRLRRLRELRPVTPNGPVQPPAIAWPERAFYLAYWNDEGKEKESLLAALVDSLLPRKYLIALDQGWSPWDVEICQGPWAKAQIRTATENHGGSRRLLRVRCQLRFSRISLAFLLAYATAAGAAAALAVPKAAAALALLGSIHFSAILYQKFHLGRALYHAIEATAHRLGFAPLRRPPGRDRRPPR
jgi:cellulose synthase/poly-beta-1,6-N-acetylglucosamine synthase-like glycosyltransferase